MRFAIEFTSLLFELIVAYIMLGISYIQLEITKLKIAIMRFYYDLKHRFGVGVVILMAILSCLPFILVVLLFHIAEVG